MAPVRPVPARVDAPASGPEASVEPESHGAQAAPAVTVAVVSREALGLEPAARGGRAHRIDRITLHHSGVLLDRAADAPARLRAHQRHHRDQGWVDVAYHYAIDPSGTVYELRDPGIAGDTLTDYDPAGHLLVVCEGDYDRQTPTPAMLASLARFVAAVAAVHGIDPAALSGHRDHAATACPGEALVRELPAVRDGAIGLAADGGPVLALVEGPEASALLAAVEAA